MNLNKDNLDNKEEENEKEIEDELDKQKAYLIFANSEAGKYLIEETEKDKEDMLMELINSYQNLSHIEIITKISKLESKINFLNTLKEAGDKVKVLEEEQKYDKKNQIKS